MKRWGITIPFFDLTMAESKDLVAELPDLGYTDAWSAEVGGTDGFVPLALAADWAPGSASAPPSFRCRPGALPCSRCRPRRSPTSRPSGSSSASGRRPRSSWSAGTAGEFVRPYGRTRDTLRFLRKALAGEKVTEKYETFEVKGFRLERAPKVAPKIVLAALRPRMLHLAAEEADGAITNWLSPEDVRKVRAEVGRETELIARLFVCVSEDAEKVRALGRRMLAAYLTVPVYAAFHDWLGRGRCSARCARRGPRATARRRSRPSPTRSWTS